MTHLRVLHHEPSTSAASAAATLPELLAELQARGLRWQSPHGLGLHRRGGAGPSDHKAIRIGGHTVMVPIHTHAALLSPFEARQDQPGSDAVLYRNGQRVMPIEFPRVPRFYARSTADGIPYWKIATLHADDVLATTVLQRCVRYGNRQRACQFCSIGQSLETGATVVEKTPAQLAEVARAAVDLDGVAHAVLTTGTPPGDDRGAAVLARCSAAITRAVALPIQAQCEPPADFAWFGRLKDAGVVSLGMHLEAVTEAVRQRIMPGKAEVSVTRYLSAFDAAVQVFGRGQVTTYILAGLGDTHEAIVELCDRVAALGVYPFVVPFVPIVGTPLQGHPPPSGAFMDRLLADVAWLLELHGLSSTQIRAGCGRCGACSTLRARSRAMLEPVRPYGEPIRPFLSSLITFGIAREPWERSGYWELRRQIFCDEQRLFGDATEEQDSHDARALPIVAVAHCGGTPDRVVGMVRIFEAADRTWYGGRLGVQRRYRARPAIGGGLIREAVCQALRRGCERFLATVQEPNVRYFTRFDFVPLQPIELHGRAHMLMQAELGAFARLAVRRG